MTWWSWAIRKQLPPTNFFTQVEGADDGAVDDDFEELESVLDECAASGLQRMGLLWHYRSRHESLIAFSNHHYYDNRLHTFPAPKRGSGRRARARRRRRLRPRQGPPQPA